MSSVEKLLNTDKDGLEEGNEEIPNEGGLEGEEFVEEYRQSNLE
jgi:hypothetical protein